MILNESKRKVRAYSNDVSMTHTTPFDFSLATSEIAGESSMTTKPIAKPIKAVAMIWMRRYLLGALSQSQVAIISRGNAEIRVVVGGSENPARMNVEIKTEIF